MLGMVAVAVHGLAMLLHKPRDLKQHHDWQSWMPPNRHIPGPDYWCDAKPYPALFVDLYFRKYAQCPERVAATVGH